MSNKPNKALDRRTVIKGVASTSARWVTPLVISSSIPSHAQTTGTNSCNLEYPPPFCEPVGTSNIRDGGVELGEFSYVRVLFNIYDLPTKMRLRVSLTTEEDYPQETVFAPDVYFACSGNNSYHIEYSRNGYDYSFNGSIYQVESTSYRTRLSATASGPDGTIQRNSLDLLIGLHCV